MIHLQHQKVRDNNYQNLIDNILDVIIKVDNKWRFTYINPQIQEIFGFRPSEFLGKNISKLIHPDDFIYICIVAIADAVTIMDAIGDGNAIHHWEWQDYIRYVG